MRPFKQYNVMMEDFYKYGAERFGHIILVPAFSSYIYELTQLPESLQSFLTDARFTTFFSYIHDGRVIAATRKGMVFNMVNR